MNNHVCKNGITEQHDDCYINMYGRLVVCHFEDVLPVTYEAPQEPLEAHLKCQNCREIMNPVCEHLNKLDPKKCPTCHDAGWVSDGMGDGYPCEEPIHEAA